MLLVDMLCLTHKISDRLRLWGFGVQIEGVDAYGNHPVLLHVVPAPAA